jgi:hypothetical protein
VTRHYEVEGVLENGPLIRLNEPLPCKKGPVKVVVETLAAESLLPEQNRAALQALDRLLAEPNDLTSEKWLELDNLIAEHPLRVREGSLS